MIWEICQGLKKLGEVKANSSAEALDKGHKKWPDVLKSELTAACAEQYERIRNRRFRDDDDDEANRYTQGHWNNNKGYSRAPARR